MTIDETSPPRTFEQFFREAEPGLRAALSGGYGAERGREAAVEALTYAWRHWERIRAMDNPHGYVYRVGERKARKGERRRRLVPLRTPDQAVSWGPHVEPGLAPALAELTLRQRQSVILVAGFGMTHREAADLLGVSASSIQSHVERGLANLRNALGVDS
ncbi:MAG: sigma factor-like helix-turn-helix DNA-binding protein [Actinomycetota bacterium]|nr:sigma factor-like helix-turn-helix DNA-binding protein [Actinomycetota bacterium]